MKIKPIYIYLGVFIIFVGAVLFFSESTKKSNMPLNDPQAQMPDDDIHGKMRSQGNGDVPSKSNLMNDAVEKINKLKSDYEKNPNDTAKVLLYADVLIAHQPEEAVKLYNKILKIDPKRVDVLLQMTYLSFNMGDVAKAEEYNGKVLSINPNNLIAKFNTGGLAQARGDNKKARSVWTDLSSRYPNSDVGRIAGELVKQLDQKETKAK